MPPAVAAAGITAGSSLIQGATAPRQAQPTNNIVGADQLINEFQPYLNTLLSGGNAPDYASLQRSFQTAQNSLYGQMQRAGNQGAKYGAGLAASQGYSNPAAFMLRARNQAFEPYANLFGNLLSQQAQSGVNFNRDLLGLLLNNRQQATQMGGAYGINRTPTNNGSVWG